MRKSSKLAKAIIVLFVIIPALWLVSLYPKMESAMQEKIAFYEEKEAEHKKLYGDWILTNDVVHYAMEASYYIYAEMANEIGQNKLDMEVFNEYGWNNDAERVKRNMAYTATYDAGEEPVIKINDPTIGNTIVKLTIHFDEVGKLSSIELDKPENVYSEVVDIEMAAKESIAQFENNLAYYSDFIAEEVSYGIYTPCNFTIEFEIGDLDGGSNFVYTYEEWFGTHYYYQPEQLYFEIGAYWIVLAILIGIVLLALILPFFKKLNTGNEKIFSMPFEVMIVVAGATIGMLYGMGVAMAYTTMEVMRDTTEAYYIAILGTPISAKTLYNFVRIISFVGWSISFFFVYAVAANIRQLLANTKYYVKYQTVSGRFLRYVKGKVLQLYNYVTEVDLGKSLNKNILKIVIANFVLLTILCCLWVFGVVGLIIYSIVLFALLKRKMKNIQNQYNSILHATEQMAEGDLKIILEEDLGVFKPIGDSLEKVQQGFEKAVKEEAKSQSMKTELITNVSHDLKTPLTAIITYVDLLKKENITEEERKSYIQTLDQKSQRLKVLIEDLFEVSKAHSGNVTMNFMDVDVVSLLKQVKSEMADQIAESNLDFRWNFATEKVILSLDGQRTYRVFENLINNILKYAMPHSRVYIDVMQRESEVKIIFRNVSAQELDFDSERLTDRFVRGDASRNSEGSGLGLAIAKSFVELQNGTFKIDVDGDLFKVTITWFK